MSWAVVEFPKAIRKTRIGRDKQVFSSDIKPSGRFPVVDQGQAFIAGYSDDEDRLISDDLPLVIFGDHTRCVKYVDFPFILGADGTKVLKPDSELFDPKFFYYAVLGLDIPNRGYNRHFTLLKEKSLRRPEKEEQRKIAAVLGLVQQAIQQQERLIALTTELKKALLHKLFTEGLRGEPQKQTEIGPVPESWEPTPLGTCCDIVSGSLSYTDFLKMASVDDGDTTECMGVKVSDMNLPGNENNFVTANAVRHILVATAHRKLISPNTVVFPKRGAAIATNKKRLTTIWTVLDPNLIGVHAKDSLDADFLFHWFQTFDLRRITDPGPTPQLNKKDLIPVLMPLPKEIDEQRDIANVISTIDRKLILHQGKHAAFTALFRTLLHQLMTAQIRVDKLDIKELIVGIS
jgi:type I restriction enzyme S subunit